MSTLNLLNVICQTYFIWKNTASVLMGPHSISQQSPQSLLNMVCVLDTEPDVRWGGLGEMPSPEVVVPVFSENAHSSRCFRHRGHRAGPGTWSETTERSLTATPVPCGELESSGAGAAERWAWDNAGAGLWGHWTPWSGTWTSLHGCAAFEGLWVGEWPDQTCVLEGYLETGKPIKKLL